MALGTLAVLVYPPLDCDAVTKIHSFDHQHSHGMPHASRGSNIQLQREPSHLTETLTVLSYGEAGRPKGGSREGSSGAYIKPREQTRNGRQKAGKGHRGEERYLWCLESSVARARAPSPIGRPVNPGGSNTTTKLQNYF